MKKRTLKQYIDENPFMSLAVFTMMAIAGISIVKFVIEGEKEIAAAKHII